MLPEIFKSKLQDMIVVDGRAYPIYTDFRHWVEIEILLFEKRGEFIFKIPEILSLCYRKLPDRLDGALRGLIGFYCGQEIKTDTMGQRETAKRLYSFYWDAELIYCAFYQQYGIDLAMDRLHWWQFKALFQGLGQETKLVQVMGYRGINSAEIKDAERRKMYRKMKEAFRLPDIRTDEEKEKEQAELLSALL